jgi:hypothetical protein
VQALFLIKASTRSNLQLIKKPFPDPDYTTTQIFSRDSEPFKHAWAWEYDHRELVGFNYQSNLTIEGTGSGFNYYRANVPADEYNLEQSSSLITFTIDAENHTGSIWIDETKLGEIENEHDFNNLRIELVKNNLTQDCYFMWNDKKITLDEEGNMSSFPRGLYDHVQMAMSELFKLRKQ